MTSGGWGGDCKSLINPLNYFNKCALCTCRQVSSRACVGGVNVAHCRRLTSVRKQKYSIFSMTEDWWSDIHFEMSTTPRRVFNQAYLYRQTGSSGIHSHKHKHIQLFVVFFSSSLRDTDDIKRRTFFFFYSVAS